MPNPDTSLRGPVILCYHELVRRPYILTWAARFAYENRVDLHVAQFGGDVGRPRGRGEVTSGALSLAEVQHRYPDLQISVGNVATPLGSELAELARGRRAYALVLPPILLQDTADPSILKRLAQDAQCPLLVMPEEWVPRPGHPVVACVDDDHRDSVVAWALDYGFERGIDVVEQIVGGVRPQAEVRGGWWPWRRRSQRGQVVEQQGTTRADLSTRRCGRSLAEVLAWPQEEASMLVATFDLLDALPRGDADEYGLVPFLVQLSQPVALIPTTS